MASFIIGPLDAPMDPNADIGQYLNTVCGVVMALSTVAVALRFLARWLTKLPLMLDDWLILVSLPFAWITGADLIWSTHNNNYGRHLFPHSKFSTVAFFQMVLVDEIAYNITLAATRFSILFLYWRIFHVASFKRPLVIVGVLNLLWFGAGILVYVFNCKPVQAFWDYSLPRDCLSNEAVWTGVGVSTLVLDIVILVLPSLMIWRLQIPRAQKIAVGLVFMVGIFIIIVSCLRIASLLQAQYSQDISWSLVPVGIWSTVECNIAVVCACLPVLRPLLRLITQGSIYPTQKGRSSVFNIYHEGYREGDPSSGKPSVGSNGRKFWQLGERAPSRPTDQRTESSIRLNDYKNGKPGIGQPNPGKWNNEVFIESSDAGPTHAVHQPESYPGQPDKAIQVKTDIEWTSATRSHAS